MKRVKLSVTALMLGGVLGSLPTAYAEGVGGTITFVGRVVEGPCQVSVNHGASTSVALNAAAETSFTVDLTGCPASAATNGVSAYIEPISTTQTDSVVAKLQRLSGPTVTENTARHIAKAQDSLSYGVTLSAVSPGSRNAIYTLQYK